jgi:pimeloyl-ACP methyl ester carboxylesterase
MLILMIGLSLLGAASHSSAAEEGFFNSNGVKIRYLTQGQGEAVVLVHGFTGTAEMWGKTPPHKCAVWEKLVKHYRLIALDCRGHGKSDKPHDPAQYGKELAEDVVRLLDHLKIAKAHLVGYSMGTTMAGLVFVTHPDRLLSVVFGGGVPLCEPNPEIIRLTELLAKGLEEGQGLVPVILAATPPPGQPKATPEAAKFISQMIIGKQDQKALGACMRSNLKLEVSRAQLQANELPVLVVYGSKEGNGNYADQKEFQRLAKLMGAKVEVIEGSDHVGTVARPELADTILAFLESVC